MSRFAFTILMAVVAVTVLATMWLAWRGRRRRDSGIVVSSQGTIEGETLVEFPRVSYVSTTPVGAPFERVAISGLRYKGFARVTVMTSGVIIAVTGEPPVVIPWRQLRGAGTANGRIGKIVERDGLSLVRWIPEHGPGDERELESSFRFAHPTEQARFAEAIETLAAHAHTASAHPSHTTQEDA